MGPAGRGGTAGTVGPVGPQGSASPLERRDERAWTLGTNFNLPHDISVVWSRPMPADFHARFKAVARRYHYVIYNHPRRSSLLAGRATWHYHPLDLARMQEAAPINVTAPSPCTASAKVTVNASQVSVSAGLVNVDAGMSKFSGVVKADTVICNSIISASYTPGAGNIW